tara:strand:- start:270 stop:719 length:450 start_codon:yes stop_codon:yes gene_type:complete
MKLTKTKLKQIIKEELNKVLSEAYRPPGVGRGIPSDWDSGDLSRGPFSQPTLRHGWPEAPDMSDMQHAAERLMDMYHHEGIEVEVVSLKGKDHLKVTYSGDFQGRGGGEYYFESEEDAEKDIKSELAGVDEDPPGSFPTGLEGLPGYTQ